ncbi:MAG: hypothetical protein JW837_08225 [Sedimentisphaerales bacterium]|nr:hypothetical protein [Sedimentisphaerales bacterium]
MYLIKLTEPELTFGYGQKVEDPRDGLTLFGPIDQGKPYGIRWAVIGTKEGTQRVSRWIKKIQGPIFDEPSDIARPPFPGFEAIFGIPWAQDPDIKIEIPASEIEKNVLLGDKYQRAYSTCSIYTERIKKVLHEEESNVDIWIVIIPDDVYKYCRPTVAVESTRRIQPEYTMSPSYARSLKHDTPSLFEEDNIAAIPYDYQAHFHNQIKARLLENLLPTQIIRESTIAHTDFLDTYGRPIRDLKKLQSAIAWNISTTCFYKAGGRPWKVGTVREGVCYIGLVFKQKASRDPRSACCAAQMFLDSGDGVVFKGADGPYYNPQKGTFHLRRKDAKQLVRKALKVYTEKTNGKMPKELFLHGKVSFNYEEWEGFKEACGGKTKVVGVRIRDTNRLKLYRKGKFAVLRGLAYMADERLAYLCTRGYIPRLQTCMGLEVPRLLEIFICCGEANLEIVLNDIMMLTKLNYNSCVFADGIPVTLRFANAVGEIVTASPMAEVPPLPFKYYI